MEEAEGIRFNIEDLDCLQEEMVATGTVEEDWMGRERRGTWCL